MPGVFLLPQGPWDTTDPNPLGNGGPLRWFNTSDADCDDPALSVNRIAYSVDRRSAWNDIYEALPVKYGSYYLFFVPVFRHWQ